MPGQALVLGCCLGWGHDRGPQACAGGSDTRPPPARALHCHVCSSSTNCKNIQLCPTSARFCKTVITGEPWGVRDRVALEQGAAVGGA